MAKTEAPVTENAGQKEKFEKAAKSALAKGDAATALAWYSLAGRDNVQVARSVCEKDAEQARHIAKYSAAKK